MLTNALSKTAVAYRPPREGKPPAPGTYANLQHCAAPFSAHRDGQQRRPLQPHGNSVNRRYYRHRHRGALHHLRLRFR
ncbi:hypothetical protein KCP74_03385 [Salmonella enterica subsp. enterica]|nr:hypothetical protein KCP74_03385 [Salmonella enterica subsp. enterica]